jgi:hypothetical protein
MPREHPGGRPSLPPDKARSEVVSFRVSPGERALLEAGWRDSLISGLDYLGESTYWRSVLLADARRRLDRAAGRS